MRIALYIVDAIIVILFVVAAIGTFAYAQKNGNKRVEEVKDELLPRIRRMNILTILLGVMTLLTIILNTLLWT